MSARHGVFHEAVLAKETTEGTLSTRTLRRNGTAGPELSRSEYGRLLELVAYGQNDGRVANSAFV